MCAQSRILQHSDTYTYTQAFHVLFFVKKIFNVIDFYFSKKLNTNPQRRNRKRDKLRRAVLSLNETKRNKGIVIMVLQ